MSLKVSNRLDEAVKMLENMVNRFFFEREGIIEIATVGKGGAGKTTIAGTLARILAKKENKILAIDGDPNPNLALTLGISRDQANNINFIPHTVMKMEEDDYGERVLKMSLSENDLFEVWNKVAR